MSSLFNSSNLDHPEEEHDEDEDGVDELVEPELRVVVDNPLDLLRVHQPPHYRTPI